MQGSPEARNDQEKKKVNETKYDNMKISKGLSHFDMNSNGVLRGKVVRKIAAACQTV